MEQQQHYNKIDLKINSNDKPQFNIIKKLTRRKQDSESYINHLLNTPDLSYNLKNTIKRLDSCCSSVSLATSFGGNTRIYRAITCQIPKLCPNCARFKANKNIFKFKEYLSKHPDLLQKKRYYMVLTIKHDNNDKLVDLLDHLTSSVDKIRQSIKDFKRWKNNSTIFRHIQGALLAFEATHWENWWHPHVNFLFCSDSVISCSKKQQTFWNEELSKAWQKKTWDSYILSIQSVDPLNHIHEIVKYVTKFSTLDHIFRDELYDTTYRFRFLRKWDLLLKCPISEESSDIEEKPTVFELLHCVFWDYNTHSYKLSISSFKRPDILEHNFNVMLNVLQNWIVTKEQLILFFESIFPLWHIPEDFKYYMDSLFSRYDSSLFTSADIKTL